MNEKKTDLKEQVDKKQFHMPRILIVYDMLVYLIAAVLLLVLYEGNDKLTTSGIFQQVVLSAGCILLSEWQEKSMDRYGDMAGSSAISDCFRQTQLHSSSIC